MPSYKLVKTLDPITLVEGVARIVIVTDGSEIRALYQIMEYRAFEKIAVGRHIEELPRIVSAICGFCSWAHTLASGKAVDNVFGRIPPTRAKLTRILVKHLQVLDSHLLHLGVIGIPDLALWNEPERDVVKLLAKNPEVASAALRARSVLKKIENTLVGKIQHGPVVLPGGVTRGFTREDISRVESDLHELDRVISVLHGFFNEKIVKSEVFKKLLEREEYTLRAYSMGLVRDGALEFYDGDLKLVDSKGRVVAEIKNHMQYTSVIEEAQVDWTYSTLTYFKPIGPKLFSEESTIMTGPLARLNVVDKVPGERAGEEYKKLIEASGGKPLVNLVLYHWARLVEILHALEMINEIIQRTELYEGDTVSFTGEISERGVGIVEAPRGILIHDYRVDTNTLCTKTARIITPTTINNHAINTSLTKFSERIVKEIKTSGEPSSKTIAEIESLIRCYDPCNSCATHCIRVSDGQFKTSFIIEVIDERGEVIWRG